MIPHTKEAVSQRMIRMERDAAYQLQQQDRRSNGSNGDAYLTNRGITFYLASLPRLHGSTFIEHIRDSYDGWNAVRVLDAGCGGAIMLRELMSSNNVPPLKTFGISAFDYREDSVEANNASGIDYRVGDLHSLKKEFGDTRFDVITFNRALIYVADPLQPLKQAYALCREGGTIFVDMIPLPLRFEDVLVLKLFWHDRGITADFEVRYLPSGDDYGLFAVSLQRGEGSHLPIPVRYVKIPPTIKPDKFVSNFTYRLDLQRML